MRRVDLTALEPVDPVPVCECTECRQDIYPGESIYTSPKRRICPECFEEEVMDTLKISPWILADALDYKIEKGDGA